MNNKITENFYKMGGFLYNGLDSIINKVSGKVKNNTEKDSKSEDLDKIIDDFLEKNDN